MIKAWLKKERKMYRQLSVGGRRLLVSSLLSAVAGPMIGVFTNAFLWQKANGLNLVVVYTLTFFVFMPFAFLLNGFLLKWFEVRRLFWLGCVLQGIVPFCVIFFNASTPGVIAVLGGLFGLAGGLYWSNRNLLTFKMTSAEDRLYYGSLEFSSATVVDIVVPAMIGWFLVYGERAGLYSLSSGYRLMALVGAVVLALSGAVAQRIVCNDCNVPRLRLPRLTKAWQAVRRLEVVHGFYHGIESVVPTAMVLLFVGREDSLGFIQSISALVAALAIYAVGRRSNERTRMRILLFWSVSTILGALAFGIWFSVVGVIIYFMISALSGDFRWVSLGAVMYDRVEQEALAEQSHAYPYLLDREFFLNAGRILGLLVFWGCSQIAPLPTLRFILLGAAVSQLAIPALARRVMTAKSA